MIEPLLKKTGTDFISRLRSQQSQRGIRASGRSARSLRQVVSEDKLEVFGSGYFAQQEEGRGPTQKDGDGALKRAILEWMKYKGIGAALNDSKRRGIAYVIARKIHKYGTKLHRGQADPVGIESLALDIRKKIGPEIMQHAANRVRFVILRKFGNREI